MRRYLYLSTAVAGVMMTTGAGTSLALCVATQDCAALGYTDSACPGSGLKCPFGDGWYCGGGAAEDCIKLGYDKSCTGTGESGSGETCNGKYQSCSCDSSYKYTCSGTGYSGGSGTACGGKYTKCTCKSPYTWSGSACTCPSKYKYTCSGTGYSGGSGTACGGKYTACSCAIGYEWKDGSCQISHPCDNQANGAYREVYCCNGKVVGVKDPHASLYIAMQDLGQMTWNDASSQCASYVFCGSLKGTLPIKNQLTGIYHDKSSINSLLSIHGGTQLTNSYYWSSTSRDNETYYMVDMSKGDVVGGFTSSNRHVRPILTSW